MFAAVFIVAVWLHHECRSRSRFCLRRQKLDEQATLGNLDGVLYLVTSELDWPFIFELWPRTPHKWRYNILPFIPSPSPLHPLNFAPEAFHRNGFQETLSFDPELQGQIVTDEEEEKRKKSEVLMWKQFVLMLFMYGI